MNESIISISNLMKSYGTNQVLKGIDLEVSPGQIIGYIGPNGAGKSTTVRILCGIDSAYQGNIQVNSLDLRTQGTEVKKIIGYIPELAQMYEVLTPMEYLHLIGTMHGLTKEEIELKGSNMLSYFGLKPNLNNRMSTFSKGMRQKVLIVSGLIHDPKIIFMDEPLTGLDANSVILVKEIISQLAADGKTIFYCSHMMDVVEKISDRIVLIDKGVIIADGSYAELSEKHSGSLETIFASMTNQEDQQSNAKSIIDSIKEEG